MTASDRYPHVFQPLTIGNVTVKHRIMVTGHTTGYGEDGLLSERHIAYFRERAKGGAALLVLEQQAAHPSGRNYHQGCRAYDPRAIPMYAKAAAAVHAEGAKLFTQLFCGGAQGVGTMYIDEWRHLLAPSAVASTQFQELPAAMEEGDIASVIQGFATSALHSKLGDLDGIEIHAAHSQLLGAFLSPAFNRRTDGYGGSTANRCRIVLEIGAAVRRAVGAGYPVGLRLSFSEHLPRGAGITPEECERQLEILAASGLFDFYDISAGGYFAKHIAVTPMTADLPHAFLAPYARRAKAVVGDRGRVFLVGRVLDLGVAEQVLADGIADMVAMTRAHMADPFVVAKAIQGRERETNRCIGANVCIRRLGENNHVACLMNPAMGREARWGHGTLNLVAAGESKRIAVVGGGPAGMKAAAVAAERGHRVVLYEASDALGGRLKRLGALPARERWGVAIGNLAEPLERFGVELRMSTTATAATLAAARPDIVVIATGAVHEQTGFSATRPERDGIPGADQPFVLDIGTAIDRATADPMALGPRVVIVDEAGDHLPSGLAELLGRARVAVEIITPLPYFGDALARTYDLSLVMPRLRQAGVLIAAQQFVEAIGDHALEAYDLYGGGRRTIAKIDRIVLSLSRRPNDSLYLELRGRFGDVRRIGDCLAPRAVEAVIHDGEHLGRSI
ncbi:MAG: FAD-dependent oxidoreductase [Alphaproteobacteria bacterium]|nr:FAD-dependent oxidoreductase [Alphaproteobacteria bacterium]